MGRGARAVAENAGDLTPRWHGSGSPEFIKIDAPGVKSTRAWV
jgi:hypothetical protein